MKPNWKECAKKAYRKGIRASEGWVPARDPPPESKDYECVVCRVAGGGVFTFVEKLRYYKALGHWGSVRDGAFVLYWKELPKIPEIKPEDVAQLIGCSEFV